MKQCSIDAVYHGEERYSKLSLAYRTEEEHQDIENALSEARKGVTLEPQIYTTPVSNGKKVIVIEFHDDYDRNAGAVFDKMLDILGIKCCE